MTRNPPDNHDPACRFRIGDRVVKDFAGWRPSEFDGWGSGRGVGVVVAPPFPVRGDDGLVDVRWPNGRSMSGAPELLPFPGNPPDRLFDAFGALPMSDLGDYVADRTERGECDCGKCLHRGEHPDPIGHVADVVFFRVALVAPAEPGRLRELARAHVGVYGAVDPFDGADHNYIELGGWLGDQQIALRFMALASLLGLASLLTPKSILGDAVDAERALMMAGAGFVSIQADR